jgi:ActR/RegA family two-component response regulator
MSQEKIEEGLENVPKPNATPVEPLDKVELAPEQKHQAPNDKSAAKRPADNDNPEPLKDSIEIDDSVEATKVMEQEAPTVTISEDIGSLLESIDLPDEFKSKAVTIFEAAVAGQVADLHAQMLESNKAVMEAYKTELAERLEAQVNTYMTESVDKWLVDNQVQVKTNLRTQIAESFMAGLLDLLETHYIAVPEDKEDVLEASLQKIEDLNKLLAEKVETIDKLKEEKFQESKVLAFESATKDLTDVQKDRIATLAESIKDTDIETYKEKLSTIIEGLTVDKPKASEFVTEEVEVEAPATEQMVESKPSKYQHIDNLGKLISKI